MGRPINKRYFGPPAAGNEIKVRFRASGQAEANGLIVKQVGSKRFKCTDGANTEVCTLADKDQGTLAVGDMTISIKDSEDSDAIKQVTKISGRKITVTGGTSMAWDFTEGVAATVEMEEAGTDTSFTGADDFEAD